MYATLFNFLKNYKTFLFAFYKTTKNNIFLFSFEAVKRLKLLLRFQPLRKCQTLQLSPIKRPINHYRATRSSFFLKHHSCTGSERLGDKIGSISARKYENAKEIASLLNFSLRCEWNGERAQRG